MTFSSAYLYHICTELRYSRTKHLFIFSEEEKQDVISKLEFKENNFKIPFSLSMGIEGKQLCFLSNLSNLLDF